MTQRTSEPFRTPAAGQAERPLHEIVVELWENGEKLVRQEVALARTELDTKLRRAKAELGAFAVGGAVLYAGLLALIAAAILLLGHAVELWLAALIVGAVVSGIGYGLVRRGPPAPADIAPTQAMHSVKQDVKTFREATK